MTARRMDPLDMRILRRNLPCAMVAIGLALSSCSATGGTVTLIPTADTSLFEHDPDFNSGQSSLVAGRNQPDPIGRARALLRFDPATQIPPGAVVVSASLTLTIVRQPSGGAEPSTFVMRRLLRDWGEGVQSGQGGGGPA